MTLIKSYPLKSKTAIRNLKNGRNINNSKWKKIRRHIFEKDTKKKKNNGQSEERTKYLKTTTKEQGKQMMYTL